MTRSYRWDPEQYGRFADERGRPFVELFDRVQVETPTRVVDLGCGPGSLTRTLVDRWPAAQIVGVDSSADMIDTASQYAVTGHLAFVHADVREWRPAEPVDVVVSNALLQWVPGHVELIADISGWLRPGGVLAFQVPDNFADPSHTTIRELRGSEKWRDRVGDSADRSAAVERPEVYLDALGAAGLVPDVWQTTYLHLLPGDDAVLEWVKGTALRPVLDALAGDDAATRDFLAELAERLRTAYPRGPYGTVFSFRRTFAVGRAHGPSVHL